MVVFFPVPITGVPLLELQQLQSTELKCLLKRFVENKTSLYDTVSWLNIILVGYCIDMHLLGVLR